MDRFYTFHNVWGSCLGTGVVAHLSRNEIKQRQAEENIDNIETLTESTETSEKTESIEIDESDLHRF